jgi:alpha-tubulin suppressor-like RCC1 family protein
MKKQKKKQFTFLITIFITLLTSIELHAQYETIIDKPFIEITGGDFHSLALRKDGTVWSWGNNKCGQLGDGTTVYSSIPSQVPGLTDIIKIAAGGFNSLCLNKSGILMAWGRNSDGQLGDGTTVDRYSPVQIYGLYNIKEIATGGQHTIAIEENGTLWAWGHNYYGKLGDGTTIDKISPVQIIGHKFIKIALGPDHSIGLKNDGSVWGWGHRQGIGSETHQHSPVQISNLNNITKIDAGDAHSIALKNDGTVWAWGWNQAGQIGIGDENAITQLTPVQVFGLTNIINIAAGSSFNIALRNDGTVWAWGHNTPLGDGNAMNRNIPIQMFSLENVKIIGAGDYHSLALLEGGMLMAWGSNNYGQLAHNKPSFVPAPCNSHVTFKSKTFQSSGTKKYISIIKTVDRKVTINYSTENGTAFSGIDYIATSGTLTFEKNETEKQIPVSILSNNARKTDRTAILSLSDPTGELFINDGSVSILTISANKIVHPPYSQAFTTIMPGNGWSYTSYSQNARIHVVSDRLRMDNVQEGEPGLNEAVLTIDLQSADHVNLKFFHINHDIENNPLPESFKDHYDGDGISISNDGYTWYRIVDAEELVTDYLGKNYEIDLSLKVEEIQTNYDNSFGFTDNFKIKFQQYGYSEYSVDGREWDNIAVNAIFLSQPPIAINQTLSTMKNKELPVILTATDMDSLTLTYAIKQQPQFGSLSGTPPEIIYTPDFGYIGQDYFEFIVNDESSSDIALINIDIIDIQFFIPSYLNIETITDKYIKLFWEYDYNNSQISYNIYRSEMPNGYYYQINTNPIRNGEHFIDDYIEAQKSYYYKVSSIMDDQESELSDFIQATPYYQADFEIVLNETHKIVNVTGSVEYPVAIQYHENFQGNINLRCVGLSDNTFMPIFYLNNQEMGETLSDTAGIIRLKIRTCSSTEPGEYQFTLKAVNTQNFDIESTDIFLTVVARQGKGISVSLEKNSVHKGDKTRIFGQIFPIVPEKSIQLTLLKDSESESQFTTTLSDGTFENTDWIQTLAPGKYQIQASWIDDTTNTHYSPWTELTIRKGQGVLTCLKQSLQSAKRGEDFTVTGNLNLEIRYPHISLTLISPVQKHQYFKAYQNTTGTYEITDNFFDQKGVYYFKAYWPGNNDYVGCESSLLPVAVETKRGMVIIVGGGFEELQNRLWLTTKFLCSKVYGHFKKNGFNDTDITLMLNTDSIDYEPDYKPDYVVNEKYPEKERFLEIIENQYSDVFDFETPLIIYMQGHGTEDGRFELLPNSEYVSYTEINKSLNAIQSQVHCPIILIIESCYSGKYIQTLKGENRIIMTSTDNRESITENNGELSFSNFLFSLLGEGYSVVAAFEKAKKEQEKLGCPPPQLSDQADAANTYLINDSWPASKPKVKAIDIVRDMTSNTTLKIMVNAQKGNYEIASVTAYIISPNLNMETATTIPKFNLTFNTQSSRYTGIFDDFICAGIYKIMLLATDTERNDSETEMTMIRMPGSDIQGDLDGDCAITISDMIIGLKILCGMKKYPSFQLSDIIYIFQHIGNLNNNQIRIRRPQ